MYKTAEMNHECVQTCAHRMLQTSTLEWNDILKKRVLPLNLQIQRHSGPDSLNQRVALGSKPKGCVNRKEHLKLCRRPSGLPVIVAAVTVTRRRNPNAMRQIVIPRQQNPPQA